MQNIEINIGSKNRTCTIIAPVPDSLRASLLADRLDKLPYLKVIERKYHEQTVTVKMYIIPKVFTIEKLHADLETIVSPQTPEGGALSLSKWGLVGAK